MFTCRVIVAVLVDLGATLLTQIKPEGKVLTNLLAPEDPLVVRLIPKFPNQKHTKEGQTRLRLHVHRDLALDLGRRLDPTLALYHVPGLALCLERLRAVQTPNLHPLSATNLFFAQKIVSSNLLHSPDLFLHAVETVSRMLLLRRVTLKIVREECEAVTIV